MLSFIMFDAPSVSAAFETIGGLFGAGNIPVLSDESIYYFKSYYAVLVIAVIGATPIPSKIYSMAARHRVFQKMLVVLEPVVLTALLLISTSYLVDGSFNPFLYFRF